MRRALMLPRGERLCGQIPSPAHSLLNYQLEFISQEDNNSHSVCGMSPVLLLYVSSSSRASALTLLCDTDTVGRNERLMSYTWCVCT